MAFKIGDRFKVVGMLASNIEREYEGKYGTVVSIVNSVAKTYSVLFDDRQLCQDWIDENDMQYVGKYPLQIGTQLRNKQDNSEWDITKITCQYEFWGICSKAGSKYRKGEEGGSSILDNYYIINNKTLMKKLSIMMKKLLDKETQLLVKAGFINGDLEITTEGQHALNSVLFTEKKAELVKLAEEVISESEKNKE